MRTTMLAIVAVGLALLLGSCSSHADGPHIQPAEGVPTFVFFYAEN